MKGLTTSSSPSEHPLLGTATANDDRGSISGFSSKGNKDGSNTVSFTSSLAGHNPLVAGSPDIDIHTKFSLTENDKAGTLKVNAVQTGDAFPSAETTIGDTEGNQLFIGVSPANGDPYTSLPGDNDRAMMSANFTITMDDKGVFTGVQQGKTTYSIENWNKMNKKSRQKRINYESSNIKLDQPVWSVFSSFFNRYHFKRKRYKCFSKFITVNFCRVTIDFWLRDYVLGIIRCRIDNFRLATYPSKLKSP